MSWGRWQNWAAEVALALLIAGVGFLVGHHFSDPNNDPPPRSAEFVFCHVDGEEYRCQVDANGDITKCEKL